MKREQHDPRVCESVPGSYMEHGRTTASSYVKSEKLRCPSCGRTTRQITNFLGGRPMLCVGSKLLRPGQYDLEQAVRADDARGGA